MSLTKKYLVFNPLVGQYTYFDNKNDVAPAIIKNALELYYAQSLNAYYKVVYVNEDGVEYDNPEGRNGTEIPEDLLLAAIQEINENVQAK
jgi:hypothetical protein